VQRDNGNILVFNGSTASQLRLARTLDFNFPFLLLFLLFLGRAIVPTTKPLQREPLEEPSELTAALLTACVGADGRQLTVAPRTLTAVLATAATTCPLLCLHGHNVNWYRIWCCGRSGRGHVILTAGGRNRTAAFLRQLHHHALTFRRPRTHRYADLDLLQQQRLLQGQRHVFALL